MRKRLITTALVYLLLVLVLGAAAFAEEPAAVEEPADIVTGEVGTPAGDASNLPGDGTPEITEAAGSEAPEYESGEEPDVTGAEDSDATEQGAADNPATPETPPVQQNDAPETPEEEGADATESEGQEDKDGSNAQEPAPEEQPAPDSAETIDTPDQPEETSGDESSFSYSITFSNGDASFVSAGGGQIAVRDILAGLGYSVENALITVNPDSVDTSVIQVTETENGLVLSDLGPFAQADRNLVLYIDGEAVELSVVDPQEISGSLTAEQIEKAFSYGNVKLTGTVALADSRDITIASGVHDLYLNGFTMNLGLYSFCISNATVNIYGGGDESSPVGLGKITTGAGTAVSVSDGGVLNIYGGFISDTKDANGSVSCTSAEVNVYGGYVGTTNGFYDCAISGSQGTINIFDGTIYGAVHTEKNCIVNMTGGKVGLFQNTDKTGKINLAGGSVAEGEESSFPYTDYLLNSNGTTWTQAVLNDHWWEILPINGLCAVHIADGSSSITACVFLTSAVNESGTAVLLRDVSGNITIGSNKTVKLILNGHVLKGTSTSSSVIVVENGANLILTDCNETGNLGHWFYDTNDLWVYSSSYSDTGHMSYITGGVITGGVGKNNKAGGGVTVLSGGTFTMMAGNIVGNSGVNGGGVNNAGTFKMEGGRIVGNVHTDINGNGSGVYNSGTFVMTSGEISYHTTKDSGAYHRSAVYNTSSFTLDGGCICHNASYDNGGGVSNLGSFIMNGGSIFQNESQEHGAGVINLGASSTFTMNGGTIQSNNTWRGNGGGVSNQGTFTMNGGTLQANSAKKTGASGGNGGGIYNAGTFRMNDGSLLENTADIYGGGVFNSGVFLLTKGTIEQNTASSSGGGVSQYDENDEAYMSVADGTISGNQAHDAGGIFITSGTLALEGGTISGNAATGTDTGNGNGGGVYVTGSAQVSLKGSIQITGNTSYSPYSKLNINDNLYLYNGKTVTVADQVSGTIGVRTYPTAKIGTLVKIADYSGNNLEEVFVSDLDDYHIYNEEKDRELYLCVGVAVTGGQIYKSLQGAIDAAVPGDEVTLLVNVSEPVTVSKTLTLNLSGHKLSGSDHSGTGITITSSGVLILKDTVQSGDGGIITGWAKGIDQSGTLYLAGKVRVSGNTANIYLPMWQTVGIASTGYQGTAGISTQEVPTDTKSVCISGELGTDYSTHLFSDNTGYKIIYHQDRKLYLATDQVVASYYVKSDGADTNPGTGTQPFKTVGRALQQAKENELINIVLLDGLTETGTEYTITKGKRINLISDGTGTQKLTVKTISVSDAMLKLDIQLDGTLNVSGENSQIDADFTVLSGTKELYAGTYTHDPSSGIDKDHAVVDTGASKYRYRITTDVIADNGTIGFVSLQKAVDSVSASASTSATITLREDTQEDITIDSRKITLAMNGHIIAGSVVNQNYAILSITGTGSVTGTVENKAELHVGDFTSTGELGTLLASDSAAKVYGALDRFEAQNISGGWFENDPTVYLTTFYAAKYSASGYIVSSDVTADDGKHGYSTLQNVIDSQGSGDVVITMHKDSSEDITVASGTITIRSDGYKISNAATIATGSTLIVLGRGDSAATPSTFGTVTLNKNSALKMDDYLGNNGSAGTLVVKEEAYVSGDLNVFSNCTITAGFFSDDPTAYLTTSYAAKTVDDSSYPYVVTSDVVADNGKNGFVTLQGAISICPNSGTVTLHKDWAESVEISEAQIITLSLNGKTLTGDVLVLGTVTIPGTETGKVKGTLIVPQEGAKVNAHLSLFEKLNLSAGKYIESPYGVRSYARVDFAEKSLTSETPYTIELVSPVADDGTRGYVSVQSAVDAVQSGTVTLRDIAQEAVSIASGKTITLDLNTFCILAPNGRTDIVITNYGTLTLTSTSGEGLVIGGKYGILQNGTLTLAGNCYVAGNNEANIYLPAGKTFSLAKDYTGTVYVTTETKPVEGAPVVLVPDYSADVQGLVDSDDFSYLTVQIGNSLYLKAPSGLYVDPVNGDDSAGDGTDENPYRTIARALPTGGTPTAIILKNDAQEDVTIYSSTTVILNLQSNHLTGNVTVLGNFALVTSGTSPNVSGTLIVHDNNARVIATLAEFNNGWDVTAGMFSDDPGSRLSCQYAAYAISTARFNYLVSQAVAHNGTKGYTSIGEAVNDNTSGTITVLSDSVGDVTVAEGSDLTIQAEDWILWGNITANGKLTLNGLNVSGTLSKGDKGTLVINSGRFSNDPTAFLDTNHAAWSTQDDEFPYRVSSEVIADDGAHGYSKITDAVEFNGTKSTTVTLRADTDEEVVIGQGQTVILDMNGHRLTAADGTAIANYGTLTLTGNGLVTEANTGVWQGGTLTLAGTVSITGNTRNLYLPRNMKFIISDGFSGSVGITSELSPTYGAPVEISEKSAKDYTTCFTSDNLTLKLFSAPTSSGDGYILVLAEPKVLYVDALNGSDETGTGSAGKPYQTLTKAMSGSEAITVICLLSDTGETFTIGSDKKVRLCAFGHTVGSVTVNGVMNLVSSGKVHGALTVSNPEAKIIADLSLFDHLYLTAGKYSEDPTAFLDVNHAAADIHENYVLYKITDDVAADNGSHGFASIGKALDWCLNEGDSFTINLRKNCTGDVELNRKGNFTLNLNGCFLTGSVHVLNGAALTVVDTRSVTGLNGGIMGVLYADSVSTIALRSGLYSEKPDASYVAAGSELVANTDAATMGDYPYLIREITASGSDRITSPDVIVEIIALDDLNEQQRAAVQKYLEEERTAELVNLLEIRCLNRSMAKGTFRVTLAKSFFAGYNPEGILVFRIEDDGTLVPVRFEISDSGEIVILDCEEGRYMIVYVR